MRETSTPKAHVAAILKRLAARYPAPRSQLNAESPWEILVSTVLAAQCTDARVNLVTPHLFARWPGPAELAEAGAAELEEVIRSTGLFRSKAKHLIAAAQIIAREHGGKVPDNMAELVRLPGVARVEVEGQQQRVDERHERADQQRHARPATRRERRDRAQHEREEEQDREVDRHDAATRK